MKITEMFPLTLAEVQEGWLNERSWPKRLGLLHFITKYETVRDSEEKELRKWILGCCREILSTLGAIVDPKYEENCGRCDDFHRVRPNGEEGIGFTLESGVVFETLVSELRTTLRHLVNDRQKAIAALNREETWVVRRAAKVVLAPADELFQLALESHRWIKLDQEPMKKSLRALLDVYRFCWSVKHGWKGHPSLPWKGQQPLPDLWYDVAIVSVSGEVTENDGQIPKAVARFVRNNPRKDGKPVELSFLLNKSGEAAPYAANLLVQYFAWTGQLNKMAEFDITE